MRAEIKTTEPTFNPISLTITFETENELALFLCVTNASVNDILKFAKVHQPLWLEKFELKESTLIPHNTWGELRRLALKTPL